MWIRIWRGIWRLKEDSRKQKRIVKKQKRSMKKAERIMKKAEKDCEETEKAYEENRKGVWRKQKGLWRRSEVGSKKTEKRLSWITVITRDFRFLGSAYDLTRRFLRLCKRGFMDLYKIHLRCISYQFIYIYLQLFRISCVFREPKASLVISWKFCAILRH